MTTLPNNDLYLSIQEAAGYLKVSTKTLRRWEEKGVLISQRTEGGHRRYRLSQLKSFKSQKNKRVTKVTPSAKPVTISNPFVIPTESLAAPAPIEQSIYLSEAPVVSALSPLQSQLPQPTTNRPRRIIGNKLKYLVISSLSLAVAAFILTTVNNRGDINIAEVLGVKTGRVANKTESETIPQVLAIGDEANDVYFDVNVNAKFDGDIEVNGGDLDTTAATFNLLNTAVATINIGGAATAINIGADTGTTTIANNVDVNGTNNDIAGTLNLSGNTLASSADLIVDPAGGGVRIGTGTASSIDLAGDDLYVTGDFEVDGSSYIPTLVIGGDSFTDLTGTGLQISSGALQTTLGTSISSGEIEDSAVTSAKITNDSILEVDLKVSNDPTADYLLTYNSSTGGFTWVSQSSTKGIETVQESDVTINSAPATTVDFLGGDFDLNENPSGELNVQLATTLASVTGVAANFDVAGQLVVGTGDATTITSAGEVQIASGQTLQIGSIELNDEGVSAVTTGAALVGVFNDNLANAATATNVQEALDALDNAIGGGSSKWTAGVGFTYLTSTTDDLVLGGSTVAGASLYFDESAANLYLGTNESLNATLTLYSSGVGITDATIATNSSGNLIIDSTNFDVTTTGINGTVIGATTRAAGNFTTLDANSTVTLSTLTTAGPVITNASGVLSSEAALALTRGGTGKSITASNGQVVYSDADSFELTTSGSTDQCLKFQSGSAPTWSECVTSTQLAFIRDTGTGVITKNTIGDSVSLRYGDSADTQLEIQNTTSGTIPTADSVAINLTGGTTGIVTDAADALYIAAEYGNGTTNTNSLVHLDLDPVNTPSGDETFYALNIDGITASSATETAINIGSGWDRELNFADTSPTMSIGNTGTLSITDGTNTLFSIADDTSEGDVTVTGDLAVNGATSADITSTTTTASIFNSAVTTLNIGGAATTLNLADAAITGTVDIGGVTADGATTVNIATQSTSADTIAIGNSNASTTVAITGGDDWSISSTGVLTLSASGSQTTAIVVTDTDYTNAISVGDNNIIGTTAGIDFDDFDLSADGLVTFASDAAGDQITITTPAADFQALVVDATTNDSTQTAGIIDLNVDSSTNTAVGGLYTTFTAIDDDAADTLYAQRTDVTIQDDITASDTVYGQYIDLTQNDTTPATVYGLAIVANDNGTSPVSGGILIDNQQATDIDITDGILIRATTNDSIVDGIDVSDAELTNAINIGANAIAGTNFSVSAAGTITIASAQTLTIGTTSLNETTGATDTGAILVGVFNGTLANAPAATNVQEALDALDNAIGAGSSKWSINTTPTPDVIYPTQSDTTAGNDFALGGTTITAAPFGVDVSANTVYIGDAATAGSTSVIFKSNAGGATGTLAYNTSDQFSFTGGDVVLGDTLTLTSDANQGINGGGLTDCDDAVNSKLLWDATTNKFSCGSDGGAGTGSSKWTDGGAITYLTATGDDLVVGSDAVDTVAPFYIDVSANTVRIGDASVAGNAILSLYANGGATGNLTYNTSDQFQFSGGDVVIDQDLTVSGGDIVSAATANLLNTTSTTINFGSAATALNIADAAITGTIDIGGVTADGATTLNLATNSTSADTIAVGNSNASTTLALTGGDDWSITAAGALDINGQFDLGDNGDTGTINTSDWDVSATGDLSNIGSITADGAISFTPGSTSDVVFTQDADSNFQIAATIASDVTLNVADITLTASGTGTTGTLNGLAITNAAAAGTTTPDSLIYIAQSDTDETVTNGIFIENTAGGTLSTGLRITETAGTITDGILISGTLGNILNTDSIDISGGGAISGATGISSSGAIAFSGLSTNGVVYTTGGTGTLNSEAQLALSRGGTNKDITATAGTIVYSDADSFELTAAGTTGQCLISNGTSAPSWTNCDNAATTPFTTSGGIIDKTTVSDRLRLLYGDAADTQLTIENTTNGTIPTADGLQIDLTGGTTGIVTDGVDGLLIATEFGNGTSSTRSGLHLDINPVDSPTSDDTLYAINIDGLSASSAVENAINIGAGWDKALVVDAATTNNSLASSTAGLMQFNIDADPAAAGTNQGIYVDYETIDDANADQTFRAGRIDFLNSSEDAADTTQALSISNSNNTSVTAVATDALIHLDNADATASSLSDGIVITSSGVDTGITDAIDVSNANLANAINFGGNFVLFDGVRQFSPSSGTWTLEDTSGNDLISAVDAGAITIGSSAVGTTAITLATDSTGDAEVVLPTGSISGTEILDDTVALTTDTSGNYVATITAGNGISGSSTTEGGTPTIALSSLTSNWSQTGAFDIVLNNASSELSFLESTGGAFFGTLDVGDLSADRTYTFPDASGTVCLTSGNCSSLSDITAVGDITTGDAFTETAGNDGNSLWFEGTTSDTNELELTSADVANDTTTVTLPAITGTLASLAGTQTFTGAKTFDDLTIADTNVSLSGVSTTLTATGTLTLDSSGTIQLGTDDDFLPQLGAGSADLGASGTPWDNLYVTALTVNGTADPYVDEAGDTMTGSLTFSGVATDLTTASNEALTLSPNGTGDVVIDTDSDTQLTLNGGGDGVDSLVLTDGDILISDGDLDVAGGDFNVILDAADSISFLRGGATDSTAVLNISGTTSASDTGGTKGLNIASTISEYADDNAADTHVGIDLVVTNSATDAGTDDIVYGIRLQDLAGTAGQSNNEYGIYQAGTSWDYGLYIEDDALFNTGLTVNGTLDANGTVTLGDGGDAITIDSNALILQTTGAGSDITINAVDQVILTDFANCTALETSSGVLTCGTDDGGSATPGGSDTQLQYNNGGAFGGVASLTYSNSDGLLTFTDDLDVTFAGSENLNITNTTLNSASDTVSIAQTLTGDVSSDALSITLTNNNASAVTGTNYALNLVNADNTTNTSVIDALALFSNDQATETLADGILLRHNASSGTLTDALQIENTTAGGTISNAINIVETAGTITTGVNIGTGVGTAIVLQNGESIDNTTNNQINLNLGATGSLLLTSSTSSTISNSAGSLILDSTGGTIDINDATIDVATQATDFEIIDNTASAFTISESTNEYLNISSTNTTTSLTLDLPVAGSSSTTGNLFTSNVAKTINLGTGTAVDTINIGTGGTAADVITLGNTGVATTFTFNSGATTTTPVTFDLDTVTTATAFDLSVDGLTTGTGLLIDDNTAAGLSSGTLLQVQSVTTDTTAVTDGLLSYFNWDPGSSTTKTGDLFRINIGASGNVDNIFNVTESGSSLFKVSEGSITSAIPHAFTAAGDIAAAYDLQFTNQTSSFIKSNAPLTVESGESFENNNLTLKTYGTGKVISDGGFSINSQETLTANSTTPSVGGASHFITANTTNPTLISNFTNGTAGQIIAVEFGDSVSDLDCTASSLSCGGADITTIASGDLAYFIYDGTNWNLINWVDVSATQTGADVAENYIGPSDLLPGDVVAIDPTQNIRIQKATSADSQRVVGIVSTQPGLVLDDGYAEGIQVHPIALVGRVPVRIASTSQAILPGDLIGASSDLGKAEKVNAGYIIGRALENWTPGSGQEVIKVFVNPIYVSTQLSGGSNLPQPEAGSSTLEARVSALESHFLNDQGVTTLDVEKANIHDLTVIGDTILGDTVINGKLNIGSLVFDNTNNSIDAIGTLKIQSLALGDIEFFGGLLTLTKEGNIDAKEIQAEKFAVKGESAGTGTLLSGDTEVFISSGAVKANSLIFVTPKTLIDYPLVVTDKQDGIGFTIRMSNSSPSNTEFDWWIVDKVSQQ